MSGRKSDAYWDKIVECSYEGCGFKTDRRHIARHEQIHSGPVTCPEPGCGKPCKNVRALTYHQQKHHKNVLTLDLEDKDVMGRVMIPPKYLTNWVKRSQFGEVKETSRIAQDNVIKIHGEGYRDYGAYLSKMNEKLRVPQVVLESLERSDVMGEEESYYIGTSFFHVDPNLDTEVQAHGDAYTNSGYAHLHLAVRANHVKDSDDLCSTMLYSNCAPGKQEIERIILHLVYDYGKVLLVTVTIFPENESEIEYIEYQHIPAKKIMKEDEDEEKKNEEKERKVRVGIPTHIGKIAFFRKKNRVEVKAWLVPTSGRGIKVSDCEADPHEVARKAKLNINFEIDNDEFLKLDIDFRITRRLTNIILPKKRKADDESEDEGC